MLVMPKKEYFMSLIKVSQLDVPLIVFNSEDWGGKSYDGEVAEEIIKFLKKSIISLRFRSKLL